MSVTTKLPVLLNLTGRGPSRNESRAPPAQKIMTPRLPSLPKLSERGRATQQAKCCNAIGSKMDNSSFLPIAVKSLADDASTDCSFNSSYSDASSEEPVFEDTHIVFDWDDTLLPTSAIHAGRWTDADRLELQKTVRSILTSAAQMGKVTIVTNGKAGWVEDSSRRYLSGLAATLEGVEVVSARAEFEHLYPEDPVAWKREAFKKLLRNEWEAKIECRGLNLIVVGDSPVEMEAVHTATHEVAGSYLVKTVKLVDLPTPQQLLGELRHLKNRLGDLSRESRSSSQYLVPKRTSEEDMASGWRLENGGGWDSDGPLFSL